MTKSARSTTVGGPTGSQFTTFDYTLYAISIISLLLLALTVIQTFGIVWGLLIDTAGAIGMTAYVMWLFNRRHPEWFQYQDTSSPPSYTPPRHVY